MKNVIKTMVVVLLLTSMLACMVSCGPLSMTKDESRAAKFIECLYDGDASGFVDLMLDELVEAEMANRGCETKALLVYSIEKDLNTIIESMVADFGKSWKYEVSVVDSYELKTSGDFSAYEIREIVLRVEHSGRKLLFFKKSDFEEMKVQMIKMDNTWYVLDWTNANI